MYDPSGLGRRATEPTLNYVPRISLEVSTALRVAFCSGTHGEWLAACGLPLGALKLPSTPIQRRVSASSH
jgi:hypothetical protein